jgi:predicted dehydrogenase
MALFYTPRMDKVRVGVIGMGNIGRHHASYLAAGKVGRCELAAIASSSPETRKTYPSLPIFDTGEKLIRSGAVDAVVIATPHYQHVPLGISALGRGLHVMVEKPIAAHKADAARLIAAHAKRRDLVFAGMFQLRAEPRYGGIRRLIGDGRLGEIARISWIITDWYRTEAYYASGGWRATWKGEGGGVLLNQCLHNLDLLQWLCGMPARVRGFCRLGRYHDIEVEDDVTAWCEFPNGATAVLTTSTGEAPGTNRLEIAGARGRLVLEKDRLHFTENETPMTDFSRTAETGFLRPATTEREIPVENAPAPHAVIMQNFVDAILDGAPLIAPGVEGINSVELANAITYSSLLGKTVELPLNAAAYERKLKQLIAGSKRKRKKVTAHRADDFVQSFRR